MLAQRARRERKENAPSCSVNILLLACTSTGSPSFRLADLSRLFPSSAPSSSPSPLPEGEVTESFCIVANAVADELALEYDPKPNADPLVVLLVEATGVEAKAATGFDPNPFVVPNPVADGVANPLVEAKAEKGDAPKLLGIVGLDLGVAGGAETRVVGEVEVGDFKEDREIAESLDIASDGSADVDDMTAVGVVGGTNGTANEVGFGFDPSAMTGFDNAGDETAANGEADDEKEAKDYHTIEESLAGNERLREIRTYILNDRLDHMFTLLLYSRCNDSCTLCYLSSN